MSILVIFSNAVKIVYSYEFRKEEQSSMFF